MLNQTKRPRKRATARTKVDLSGWTETTSAERVAEFRARPNLKQKKAILFEPTCEEGEEPRIIFAHRPRPMKELGRFTMVSQRNMEALAACAVLPGKAPLQVFIFLLSRLDYDGTASLNVIKTANLLGISRSDVYRGLGALEKAGFLARIPDPDTHRALPTYAMNPFFAARGKSKAVELHQARWNSLHKPEYVDVADNGQNAP